jgi:uncharacterized protein YkwD
MAKKQTHTTKGIKPPKHHSAKMHAKVYWPYIPLIVLLFGAAFINIWQPLQSNKTATLAYSTEMSRSALLSATNVQRNSNGQSSLTINDKLNAAAQAKANDMVARNYWSHNTPDGEEPWVFFDAQGYVYTKAGENLAYGFDTSNATIIGWMNSPTHKANLLDSAFTEVGFGFANSSDFVTTGEETIVVAEYGRPAAVAAAETVAPEPVAPVAAKPKTTTTTPAPEPAAEQPVAPIVVEEDTVVNPEPASNQPTNTDSPVVATETKRISRIQQITGGAAPWSALVVSIAAFALAITWLVKHFVQVKRIMIEGEYFVAHHPVFDLLVVSIIAVAVYLSQSTGVIL